MEMKEMTKEDRKAAFTLMELLLVLVIIVILVGLAFPVFQGVLERAKKLQAKNDLTQIVTAVNAFYTEYGKYPVNVPVGNTTDAYFGGGTVPTGDTSYGTNDLLFDVLRNNTTGGNSATVTLLNPRQIVFISPPDVKYASTPKSGIGIAGTNAPTPLGQFWDPWGSPYNIEIDANYDNQIPNPYGPSGGAGADPIRQGVIAW